MTTSFLNPERSFYGTDETPPSTRRGKQAQRAPAQPNDLTALRQLYLEQNELIITSDFVPTEHLAQMVDEAVRLAPEAQRKHVPFYKKSGSVSHFQLRAGAPAIHALYYSPAFIEHLEAITGAKLLTCPEDDPHATAIYYYTEAGDHIGFHYDTSHYAEARYTVLIGLVDNSSSRLVCYPFRKTDAARADEALHVATSPGTLVLFNGDRIYHGVTPVSEGETRIVLTFEYVTSRHMSWARRKLSNVKDAMTYFGFGALLRGTSAEK